MKLFFRPSFFALALLVAGVLPGCHRAEVPALQTGKACTVQFRRDALGAGTHNPVPPMTHSINGAETCVTGTLKQVTAEWLVIEKAGAKQGSELWIPREVVLLIEQ